MSGFKYYSFVVDPNFSGDKDISIMTSLTDEFPWANPDIFLSRNVTYPNATDRDIQCSSFGQDICTINKNEIKPNETWYVGVSCNGANSRGSKCVYNILLEYIEEYILTESKPIEVYLYEGQEKLFRFYVPNDTDIKHIQISSRGKDSFSKFQMLTVKGNDPPGTDRLTHSWPVWNNGWVSRFEPGCDCF